MINKLQMLKRLQFSNNYQTAIRANALLTGQMSEDEIKGMFLTSVLMNNYNDAIKRADEDNLKALLAKDFTIGLFVFTKPNESGYISGEKYYLKIQTVNGEVKITPPVYSDATELSFLDIRQFLYSFQPSI